ncbi:polysaccharide pyruvyl transferase family protein [Haloechinothrix salitolerans]|uniref:Polysaccharide pyruvyl transferase family protein n=1 Tax=Haloechinothrix salitolerans TaxID=926830 RepID=A0ABW2C995_9PSEU
MAPWDHPRDRIYYLITPAGFPNYGDELIADGWLRYLAEVAPDAEVWVDTHSPGPAQLLHGATHPRVRFVDTLWRLCGDATRELDSDDPWEVAAWVQRAVADPGIAPARQHGIAQLHRADVFHVLGGGYVNGIWPHHFGLLGGVAAVARTTNARTAMTGQGLVPVPEDATPLLRALTGRFDVVDVRDAESADVLGIEPGLDDAFLAIAQRPAVAPEDVWPGQAPPEVMVCVQSDRNDTGPGALAGAVLSLLRVWRVRPETVCFLEGIPRVDNRIVGLIEQELPGARFYSFAELWDNGLPVMPSQTWVSTRFHLHLVAAAAGASGIAVPISENYYTTKHRSLLDLGSNWTLLSDFGELPARPGRGGFDTETLDGYRKRKRQLAESVYAV